MAARLTRRRIDLLRKFYQKGHYVRHLPEQKEGTPCRCLPKVDPQFMVNLDQARFTSSSKCPFWFQATRQQRIYGRCACPAIWRIRRWNSLNLSWRTCRSPAQPHHQYPASLQYLGSKVYNSILTILVKIRFSRQKGTWGTYRFGTCKKYTASVSCKHFQLKSSDLQGDIVDCREEWDWYWSLGKATPLSTASFSLSTGRIELKSAFYLTFVQ